MSKPKDPKQTDPTQEDYGHDLDQDPEAHFHDAEGKRIMPDDEDNRFGEDNDDNDEVPDEHGLFGD